MNRLASLPRAHATAASTPLSPRRPYGTDWDPHHGEPSRRLLAVARLWRDEGRAAAPVDAELIARLQPDATVMEIGPGVGDALPALQRALPRGRVVVLERSSTVIAELQTEFRDAAFHFVQGHRPADARQAAHSVDYLRLKRVAPYLDADQLAQTLQDAAALLKPEGRLFFTSYHDQQTEVPGFRTQRAADTAALAAHGGLRAVTLEIALIAPGGEAVAPPFALDVADATPARWQDIDRQIADRRAAHPGALEVELRWVFAPDADQRPLRDPLPEE